MKDYKNHQYKPNKKYYADFLTKEGRIVRVSLSKNKDFNKVKLIYTL